MIWAQPGHLTHKPSGTRLALAVGEAAIGVRVFLNQAIGAAYQKSVNGGLAGPWHVVAGAGPGAANPLHQVVDRLFTGVGIELRRFDDQQRRRVVVEEKVVVGLVELAQVVGIGVEGGALGISGPSPQA